MINPMMYRNTFQEGVVEADRGAVFGTQMAMQSIFMLVKDIFVIVLPDIRTFGILIVVSWLAIAAGNVSYAVYCWQDKKRRKHAIEVQE